MAVIFWVEDQMHWINKFSQVLTEADLDGSVNELLVYHFAEAAKQAIKQAGASAAPDIALLDARLNGNDQAGFSVSEALRKKWPDIPILYLSEHSGTDIERDALETHSAADFISKQQRNADQVLCWRLRASLKQKQPSGEIHEIISGPLRIDLDNWNIYWNEKRLMNPANARRALAPMPRKLLRELVECSPRPLSTLQMAEHLDLDPERFSYAAYRQHIRTLRQSIDAAEGGNGRFLERCKQGEGIVTFGDEQAYCWRMES